MALLLQSPLPLTTACRHPRQHPHAAPVVATPPRLLLLPRQRTQAVVCRAADSALAPGLDVLRTSRPIDRLRYQARLVFDRFDADGDGRLSLAELRRYFEFSAVQLGAVQELQEQYAELEGSVAGRAEGAQAAGFEEFVDLVRAQVAGVKRGRGWLAAQLPGRELARLQYKAALTESEMAVVLATFKLLDADGSGLLPLRELQKAQGIEKQVVSEVLEDADGDADGCLTFEDFLTSYHKERPVFMAMAIMAAHTACFWAIFQLPVDTMFKMVLSVLLLMKPQLVTGPVMRVWAIGKAVWGRILATREMAARGASWSSLA